MPKITKKLSYEDRVKSFKEVQPRLSLSQAVKEANRCLYCWEPPCREGCPVGINIPGFIKRISQKNFKGAAELIYADNPFGEVCGRVCPQESLCEEKCRAQALNYPIAIGELQRFVCNLRVTGKINLSFKPVETHKEKMAVIGAGPGGMSAAYYLRLNGFNVDVYDQSPHPGGILRNFLPQYRLPSAIVGKEIQFIEDLGVKIILNKKLGKDIHIEGLKEKYAAVILAVGLSSYKKIGLPGEQLEGVLYPDQVLGELKNQTETTAPDFIKPGKILVIGGGNVAMDCADSLRRISGVEVEIIYRRDFHNMPAWESEVENVLKDGVQIKFLTNPVEILEKNGKVSGLKVVRMKLGKADSSGRPRPVPIEGSEFEIKCSGVVMAIGQERDINMLSEEGFELKKDGEIIVDSNMQTSIPGVFAIGDLVTGPLTAVHAIQSGKEVSSNIYNYIQSRSK